MRGEFLGITASPISFECFYFFLLPTGIDYLNKIINLFAK